MATPRVTIRDVAREAGVSTTTVSDALNGRGRLPATTRERVAAVATRLGYRASPTARRLRGGRPSTIGLYAPLISDVTAGLVALDYYMRLTMGAAEEALAHGLAVTLMPPRAGRDALLDADVDGLIVVDPLRDDPALPAIARRGLPIVTCERDLTPGAQHAGEVVNDHRGALRELLAHLTAEGAERIALIAPTAATSWGAELQDAYADWCAEHGRRPRRLEMPIAAIERDAHDAAATMLDDPEPPDAIICAPEGGAAGVLRAAVGRGLRVPADLLVANAVDSAALASTMPPVTAIELRPDAIGRAAAGMLGRLLAGEPAGERVEVVPTTLNVRASSTRAPERHERHERAA